MALGNTPHKSPKLSKQVKRDSEKKKKYTSEVWKVTPQKLTGLKDPEPQQLEKAGALV